MQIEFNGEKRDNRTYPYWLLERSSGSDGFKAIYKRVIKPTDEYFILGIGNKDLSRCPIEMVKEIISNITVLHYDVYDVCLEAKLVESDYTSFDKSHWRREINHETVIPKAEAPTWKDYDKNVVQGTVLPPNIAEMLEKQLEMLEIIKLSKRLEKLAE